MHVAARILVCSIVLLVGNRACMSASSAPYISNNSSTYPVGVADPASVNPPGPAPEDAVAMPTDRAQVGTTPLGSPVYATAVAVASGQEGRGEFVGNAITPGPFPADDAYAVHRGENVQSSWYARVDYMHWNERVGGSDFVNENGTLFTLGYTKQIGIERFRAEFFGGDVHYDGFGQFDSGMERLVSNTGYLGVRGEYEMVMAPAAWEGRAAFLMGIGSRLWVRDLHDGTSDLGNPVSGYQETWWTTYPFVGFETHRPIGAESQWYTQWRCGMTAITYQYATIMDRPLWPKMGAFANAEIGLRGQRFFISARTEIMTWEESSQVQDSFQPRSLLLTVGGRFGIYF